MYAGVSWDEMPIIAIDTETTGFRRSDRIVELGMVMFKGSDIIDTYHSYLNPGFHIPEETTEIHGISDKDVADAPRFDDIRVDVMDWLCRGAPWVAHNARFDMRMLSYDLPADKWPTGVPTLCTLLMAKKRGHSRAKLGDLAAHYNISQENAHTAVDDARVCGLLARKITAGFEILDYFTKYSQEWL